MQDQLKVHGVVLKAMPVGEYDKVLTILTKEKGKISAFSRNARRMNIKLMAVSNPFCTGEFALYPGRNAYTVTGADVQYFFEELRDDMEAMAYGTYFLEIADYYTRENNDEMEMMNLLFFTLRALVKKRISYPLIRAIYECKALVVNGEFPGIPSHMEVCPATALAVERIVTTEPKALYSFDLSKEALEELQEVAQKDLQEILHHTFKSLQFLESLL